MKSVPYVQQKVHYVEVKVQLYFTNRNFIKIIYSHRLVFQTTEVIHNNILNPNKRIKLSYKAKIVIKRILFNFNNKRRIVQKWIFCNLNLKVEKHNFLCRFSILKVQVYLNKVYIESIFTLQNQVMFSASHTIENMFI